VSTPAALAPYAEPRRLKPTRKLALAAEILVVDARVARALRRHDIRTVLERIRGRELGAGDGPSTYAAGARLGKAVTQVLGPLPLESGCLRLSLVLCALLARRGVGSSVVIGVKGGSRFGAHAWVELAGRPVLPASETEFERLVEL
jgi:hypothetical protein